MGSDTSPHELFKATLAAAKELGPQVSFLLFAKEQYWAEGLPIEFQLTQEVIHMADEPVQAIRSQKSASLVLGIKALKNKKIDAFISAGNTGALIAAASLFLPKLPGIKRPALLAFLPSKKGWVSVIDVGGNVQCKASLLHQYALLGIEHHRAAFGIEIPRVGLLNIGHESKKGTAEHQEAFELLSSLPNFIGNVEGRDVFFGDVEVLVTDGFTGNVFLKTAEGVATFIFEALLAAAPEAARPEIAGLYQKFNWRDHPGALVAGVKGLVMKCHGSSGQKALGSGVRGAVALLCRNQRGGSSEPTPQSGQRGPSPPLSTR